MIAVGKSSPKNLHELPYGFLANCFSIAASNSRTCVLYGGTPLIVLDWDVVQIVGSLLEAWLPSIFHRLGELSRLCRARSAPGVRIEDQNSGTILLQQARRRELPVGAIESKLTAMGKDERALAASPCVHQGQVKYSDHACDKITTYKGKPRNHFLEQVEGFRVGDKKSAREDDLLDTFCYGIPLALDVNRF
jgi:hypothetical protein